MYTILGRLFKTGSTGFTMILIYHDESGINYRIEDHLYVDGPFLIMGAMLVNEDVYWSMERLFAKLIDRYFNIRDWLDSEIHATDIWHGNSLSSQLSIPDRRNFFDEFLQLCGKFTLPYVFSFVLKQHNQTIPDRNSDILRSAWCLLTGIEGKLARIHQTGIIVCDSHPSAADLSMQNIRNLDIDRQSLSAPQALLREFYEMTSWRTLDNIPSFTLQPKYTMESMSVYLIDRVHFLHSYDSLFLQMCDLLTFIVQRCLVHDYLLVVHKDRIDPDKVPVTEHGISTMRSQIYPFCYCREENDVLVFEDFLCHVPNLLLDFAEADLSETILEHYASLQSVN